MQSSYTAALSRAIAILIQHLFKRHKSCNGLKYSNKTFSNRSADLALTISLGNPFQSLKKRNNAGQTPEVPKLCLVELKNLLDTAVLFSSLGDLKTEG